MIDILNLNSLPLSADAPKGQKKILKEHLNFIVQECLKEFETIEAIILYGGYGRGEGSWIEKKHIWKPYNDYDIVVIVQKKIKSSRVAEIRLRLAKQLDISWVDLSQKTPSRMKWLRPSIYNFDLKNASSTIYGDKKFSESIPFIDSSKIPLKEILTLFLTRLWPFMGALHKHGFDKEYTGDESRFFRNQMAKAVLATADVLLLLDGNYHASYIERIKRVCNKNTILDSEREIFQWALDEKLLPKNITMSPIEVVELYDQVHSLFSKVMYKGLSSYFEKKIVNLQQLEKLYRYNFRTGMLRFMHVFLKRNLNYEKVIKINIAQMYLFDAYQGKGQVDNKTLYDANKILLAFDPLLKKDQSWLESCKAVANIRNLL
jgi:hypothetical protein